MICSSLILDQPQEEIDYDFVEYVQYYLLRFSGGYRQIDTGYDRDYSAYQNGHKLR
jgi:hypothetical protein